MLSFKKMPVHGGFLTVLKSLFPILISFPFLFSSVRDANYQFASRTLLNKKRVRKSKLGTNLHSYPYTEKAAYNVPDDEDIYWCCRPMSVRDFASRVRLSLRILLPLGLRPRVRKILRLCLTLVSQPLTDGGPQHQ